MYICICTHTHTQGILDMTTLYRALSRTKNDPQDPSPQNTADSRQNFTQSACLKPRLRPYQIRAVQWMCSRESDLENARRLTTPHPLLRECVDATGRTFYWCEWSGLVARAPTCLDDDVCGGPIYACYMYMLLSVHVCVCVCVLLIRFGREGFYLSRR